MFGTPDHQHTHGVTKLRCVEHTLKCVQYTFLCAMHTTHFKRCAIWDNLHTKLGVLSTLHFLQCALMGRDWLTKLRLNWHGIHQLNVTDKLNEHIVLFSMVSREP